MSSAPPAKPAAHILRTTGRYHTGTYCAEVVTANDLPAGTKLFTHPSPARDTALLRQAHDALKRYACWAADMSTELEAANVISALKARLGEA